MEYNSAEIAGRIKERAKLKKMTLKELLHECDLSINMVSRISSGTDIASLSLARIADQLDCSVDYLLGRTENPEVNR